VCILDVVITSRYCFREDNFGSPLLLIVEVLTGLGPVIFPFTPESFLRKNFGVLLVVVAGFIFLYCSCVS
jgi:hypothetical protein